MALDTKVPMGEPEAMRWASELEDVGFVRRILMARKWYHADWWFVTISAVMVVGFIVLALVPQVFASFSPQEQVGPRYLAPGESPDVEALIAPVDSGFSTVGDLAVGERISVAVVMGEPSSEAVRDESDRVNAAFKEQGIDAEAYLWVGVFTTAGLPEKNLAQLRDLIRKAAADPAFKSALEKVKVVPNYLDTQEFKAFFDADYKRMARAVQRIGKL